VTVGPGPQELRERDRESSQHLYGDDPKGAQPCRHGLGVSTGEQRDDESQFTALGQILRIGEGQVRGLAEVGMGTRPRGPGYPAGDLPEGFPGADVRGQRPDDQVLLVGGRDPAGQPQRRRAAVG
jgi:hypothetical protein